MLDRKCSKMFCENVLPTAARSTCLKTCDSKSELGQKMHAKSVLQLTCLMQIRIKFHPAQFFGRSLGTGYCFFENDASCLHGGHIFAKRIRAFSIKNITFLTPKRLRKEPCLSLLLAIVAPLLVRFAMCSLRAPFKNRLWPDSRAIFASKHHLQKRLYAYHLHFLNFVCDLLFSLCLLCFTHVFLPEFYSSV